MKCTGEKRREQICREYDIKAIGCYKLFDGREIESDAGGNTITDKYYLFQCIHKKTRQEEMIQCGQPTAKHICNLCGIELPSEFNPFLEVNGGGGGGSGGSGGKGTVRWHKSRRQLYNAIMLFITRYGTSLKPDSPIFKIKNEIESDVTEPVKSNYVLGVNTIIGKYNTNITKILNDLSKKERLEHLILVR